MERNEVSNWTAFGILAAFLFVGAMITIWACRDTPEARAASARAQSVPVQRSAQVGQVVRLMGREALLAPTLEAGQEIALLRRAGDRDGLQRMIDNDLALLLREGILMRVLALEPLSEQARVRIMSGSAAGQDGWLPSWYVEP